MKNNFHHRRFLKALTVAVLLLPMIGSTTAFAQSKTDKIVHKALKDRTRTFCKAVLPAWFSATGGTENPEFRAKVTDCYLGNARLTILGLDDGISLKDTGLSELPAFLLKKETGMSLDVYRPLAGRSLKDLPKGN